MGCGFVHVAVRQHDILEKKLYHARAHHIKFAWMAPAGLPERGYVQPLRQGIQYSYRKSSVRARILKPYQVFDLGIFGNKVFFSHPARDPLLVVRIERTDIFLTIRVDESRDTDLSSNSLTISHFGNKMGGDYSVGGSDADFSQLADAAQLLSNAGVCAATNLFFTKSAQKNPVFMAIPGSSANNKLTVEPAVLGEFSVILDSFQIKTLKNATFKKLEIKDVVLLDGPSKSVEFANCQFDLRFNDGSLSDSGLVLRQCLFPNSLANFQGSPQFFDRDWVVDGCEFGHDGNFQGSGSNFNNNFQFVKGIVVKNSRFRQSANLGFSTFEGPVDIEKNQFGAVPALAMSFSTGSGLDTLIVANNFFHFDGLLPTNISSGSPAQIGLSDLKNLQFSHNSIQYSSENPAFEHLAAISVYDWENCRFENNLIKTAGGNANVFNFGVSWTNKFDYNNFDAGPEGIIPIYQSLAQWQNLTGLDLNSTDLAVKFEAENDPSSLSTDLHLAGDSPNLPLTTHVLSGITTDFDGQPRGLTLTAVGADEPSLNSAAGAVWPGDFDANNQVTTLDWLHLGLALGQNPTGPARADQSIGWSPKFAADWPDSVQNVNSKHADANGDGHISLADTLAFVQNFGEEHFILGKSETRSGMVLKIEMPAGPFSNGQKITAPIILGHVPDEIYGLAFDLEFSQNAIKPSSCWVEFPDSWLGKIASSSIGFYKKNTGYGQMPVALTRFDGQNATGFGQIGTLHFEVGSLADSLKIEVVGTHGILANGEEKPITPEPTPAVEILVSQKNLSEKMIVQISPNPTSDLLFLEFFEENYPVQSAEISIFNTVGVLVFTQKTTNGQAKIDVSNLPAGLYEIKILGEKGVFSGSFILQK